MIRSGADRRFPILLGLLLAALSSVGSSRAHADDLGQARRHFAEGQRRYGIGDWARAYESYEAAYEAAPLADLLFNMGQCQRKLGNPEAALDLFRRFLETGPPAEPRAVVMDLVRELEAQRSPDPPRVEREPPPPVAPDPTDPPQEEVVTHRPESEPRPREPTRGGPTTAFWLVGGAGAAALVTAGVLTALAEAGRTQFQDRIDAGDPEGAYDLVDGTRVLYLARNVSVVVSAIALAGAAVLLAVGSGSDGADDRGQRVGLAIAARSLPGGAIVEGSARW